MLELLVSALINFPSKYKPKGMKLYPTIGKVVITGMAGATSEVCFEPCRQAELYEVAKQAAFLADLPHVCVATCGLNGK